MRWRAYFISAATCAWTILSGLAGGSPRLSLSTMSMPLTTWPTTGLTGQLSQDLPPWTHFEQATAPLTEEQVTSSLACGRDIGDELVESVGKYVEAGYDHIYFHQIGADQEGFFRFWERDLRPALAQFNGS